MSTNSTSRASLREAALKLDRERLALENIIGSIVEALGEHETGSLLIDGAPRGDLDLAGILELRGSLACARNDLKAKMIAVEKAMLAAMTATD